MKIKKQNKENINKNQRMMLEETGVQSSLNEEDAKQYLNEIMKELGKQKNSSANTL